QDPRNGYPQEGSLGQMIFAHYEFEYMFPHYCDYYAEAWTVTNINGEPQPVSDCTAGDGNYFKTSSVILFDGCRIVRQGTMTDFYSNATCTHLLESEGPSDVGYYEPANPLDIWFRRQGDQPYSQHQKFTYVRTDDSLTLTQNSCVGENCPDELVISAV